MAPMETRLRRLAVAAVLAPVALVAVSADVRALALELLRWVHGAFVVVYLDAEAFIRTCF